MSSRSASSRASSTIEGRPRAASRNASASVGGTRRSIRVPPCGWTSEDISGLLWGFGSESAVQAAFGLGEGAPPSGAGRLSRPDLARAGSAADARISALVQRVGGDAALPHARPDLGAGPGGERIHLDEPEIRIALHHAGPGALRGLVAADGGDPGVEQQHLGAQRLDLAQIAALVRRVLPERRPRLQLLLGDGQRGRDSAHADAVAALQLPPQLHGLGEEQAGIEGKHVDRELLARDRLEQHASLGPERGREADAARETPHHPAERCLGRRAFQLGGGAGDVGGDHRGTSRRATGGSCRVAAGKAVKRTPTVNTMVASAVRSDRSGTLPASSAPVITPGTAPASTARASAGSSLPAKPWPAAATTESRNACA